MGWLSSNASYFIISQGIWLGMVTSGANEDGGWNVQEIEDSLKRLQASGRIGYPCGVHLDCPIWNGDKANYINIITEFTIPTLKLELTFQQYEEKLHEIKVS